VTTRKVQKGKGEPFVIFGTYYITGTRTKKKIKITDMEWYPQHNFGSQVYAREKILFKDSVIEFYRLDLP